MLELGDQEPLNSNKTSIEYEGGWTFEIHRRELDRRVFFFPGNAEEPPSACKNFLKAKLSKGVKVEILRIPMADLLKSNECDKLQFCKYNSGAARMHSGKKSPRGPNTSVSAQQATFSPSQVVELVFLESAQLPLTTMIKERDSWALFQ